MLHQYLVINVSKQGVHAIELHCSDLVLTILAFDQLFVFLQGQRLSDFFTDTGIAHVDYVECFSQAEFVLLKELSDTGSIQRTHTHLLESLVVLHELQESVLLRCAALFEVLGQGIE